jgi:hypothetical protein
MTSQDDSKRQAAIDRLVERLTGVWAKAMLRSNTDADNFGMYLKAAMDQTESLTKAFCDFTKAPTASPNGTPTTPVVRK